MPLLQPIGAGLLEEAKKSIDEITPALGRYGLFSVYQHSFEFKELYGKYEIPLDDFKAADPIASLNQVLTQLYDKGATKEEIRFSFVGAFYELTQADIVAVINDLLSDSKLCIPEQFLYALMEDAARKDPHNWLTYDLSGRGPGFGEGMEYGRVRLVNSLEAEFVGKSMEGWDLVADGGVGRYAGAEMKDGRMRIIGPAGPSVGCLMEKGQIIVENGDKPLSLAGEGICLYPAQSQAVSDRPFRMRGIFYI